MQASSTGITIKQQQAEISPGRREDFNPQAAFDGLIIPYNSSPTKGSAVQLCQFQHVDNTTRQHVEKSTIMMNRQEQRKSDTTTRSPVSQNSTTMSPTEWALCYNDFSSMYNNPSGGGVFSNRFAGGCGVFSNGFAHAGEAVRRKVNP